MNQMHRKSDSPKIISAPLANDMKTLTLILPILLAFSVASPAASPVEDYIAARDAYAKRFAKADNMENERDRDAHEAARRELETRLRAIVGPSELKGFPKEGKITLESLAEGDEGFGLLDGLVHASSDETTRIVVTTRELLDRWLAAHKKWWGDKNDMPPGLEPALKSEAFYTQALSTDAYFYKFADIPVARPAGATFAFATLVGRAQDLGLQMPKEVVVTLLRGEQAYVIVAPAAATVEAAPQCVQAWKKAEKQALQKPDRYDELSEEAYRAYRRCFAAQAPQRRYFPAIVRQAQALIDALPTK